MRRPIPACPAKHAASVSSHHHVLSSTHPHWTQPVISKMVECWLPQLSILPTAVGQSENNIQHWKTVRFSCYQPVLYLCWHERGRGWRHRTGSGLHKVHAAQEVVCTQREVVCVESMQRRKQFACNAGSSLRRVQEAVCMECLHKLNLQLMKSDSNSFSAGVFVWTVGLGPNTAVMHQDTSIKMFSISNKEYSSL